MIAVGVADGDEPVGIAVSSGAVGVNKEGLDFGEAEVPIVVVVEGIEDDVHLLSLSVEGDGAAETGLIVVSLSKDIGFIPGDLLVTVGVHHGEHRVHHVCIHGTSREGVKIVEFSA